MRLWMVCWLTCGLRLVNYFYKWNCSYFSPMQLEERLFWKRVINSRWTQKKARKSTRRKRSDEGHRHLTQHASTSKGMEMLIWKRSNENRETRDFLKFLGKIRYDHRQVPEGADGAPVMVNVSIVVSNIRAVTEVTMVICSEKKNNVFKDYSLELFYRESWRDPRLQYSSAKFKNKVCSFSSWRLHSMVL